jgi:hypothetical protein
MNAASETKSHRTSDGPFGIATQVSNAQTDLNSSRPHIVKQIDSSVVLNNKSANIMHLDLAYMCTPLYVVHQTKKSEFFVRLSFTN